MAKTMPPTPASIAPKMLAETASLKTVKRSGKAENRVTDNPLLKAQAELDQALASEIRKTTQARKKIVRDDEPWSEQAQGADADEGVSGATSLGDSPVLVAQASEATVSGHASGLPASTPSAGADAAASSTVSTPTSAASTGLAFPTTGALSNVAMVIGAIAVLGASGSGGKRETPDTTPPQTGTLSLSNFTDTGTTSSDGITTDNSFGLSLTGQEVGSTVVYQQKLDGGEWVNLADTNLSALADGNYQFRAQVTDAAGNTAVTNVLSVVVDNAAPLTVENSISLNADTREVSIEYQEALDASASDTLSPDAFRVTTDGVNNPVDSVVIQGNKVILTLVNAFTQTDRVTVAYTDADGDGSQTLQDLAGNDAGTLEPSAAADGYIRGAQIYLEDPQGGRIKLDGVVTDDFGNFYLPPGSNPNGYAIVAVGGVNIDTGIPNATPLKAPAGSLVINPLTSLVQNLMEANPGTSVESASQFVATALGLDGVNLTAFDPLSAMAANGSDPVALAAQQAAAQVATLVTLVGGENEETSQAVFGAVINQMVNTGSINLADSNTLTAVVGSSNSAVDAAALSSLTDAMVAIGQSQDLESISASQAQFLDNVAPGKPTLNAEVVTKDNTPTIKVTLSDVRAKDGTAAITGDLVSLFVDGVKVDQVALTAEQVANGFVRFDAPMLKDGSHTISAQVSDQSGNTEPGPDASITLTVDTVAPVAPSIGMVGGDNLISAAEQGAVVTGTAEAGSAVELTLGTGNVKTLTANASTGVWSHALTANDIAAMGQGSVTVSAVARDAAGNTSPTADRVIAIDTLAPTLSASITGAADDVTPNVGNVPSGGNSNDNTLELSGTLSSSLGQGEALLVYARSAGAAEVLLGQATVSGASWTFRTPGLANATHDFVARVEDAAGNTGAFGSAYRVTVDATTPTQTVAIATAQGIGNDATPTLNGSVSASLPDGYKLVVYDGAIRLGEATVTDLNWSFTPGANLSQGAHAFRGVVESSGGNQGVFSQAVVLTIDTLAPTGPAIDALAGDNKVNAAEQSVALSGQAEANATVTLTLGVGNVKNVSANDKGVWTYALQAADIAAMGQGSETITAVARDAAGNSSNQTVRTIEIDTQAPDAPIITSAPRINAADRVNGVSIAGTSEANASVSLTFSGASRLVMANGAGEWAYELTSADYQLLGQGEKQFTVTARDAAGNSSTATSALTIDTVAPVFASFGLADTSDTGVKGDARTQQQRPTLEFTAEAGVTYAVFLNGATTSSGNAIPAAEGSTQFSYTFSSNLAEGTHTIRLVGADAVGNTTVRTSTLIVDSTAPVSPTVTDNVSGIASAQTTQVAYTYTFAEPVAGLTANDFTAVNATVTSVTKSVLTPLSNVWTVHVTPKAGVNNEAISLTLKAGAVNDAAGNLNALLVSAEQWLDNVAPSVTAVTEGTVAALTNAPISFSVTLNEALTAELGTGNFTATNGTVSQVSQVSDTSYTVVVTPTAGVASGNVALSLVGGSLKDAAGNALASVSLSSLASQAI
ncbi:MAG: hypothetical protein E6Q48_04335, partial [Limnohabitans sp.]